MGATHDVKLLQETYSFIKNKSRDQDIVYFFRGLSDNIKMRRGMVAYFENEYDTVSNVVLLTTMILRDETAHRTLWGQLYFAISCYGLCSS